MKIIKYFCIIILMVGCGTKIKKSISSIPESKHVKGDRFKDSLAFYLCQIHGYDQVVRPHKVGDKIDWDVIEHADSINFKKIIAFVEDNGFPNEKLLGKENYSHECVGMAAPAVLLHNPHLLVKNKQYFDLFLKEVKKGNLKGQDFADLLDKYYWSKKGNKKHVLYGGAFGMPCRSTKDETNRAREIIGLKPLADSLFINCE